VIFQIYKNANLRSVHSLGWLFWLWFYLTLHCNCKIHSVIGWKHIMVTLLQKAHCNVFEPKPCQGLKDSQYFCIIINNKRSSYKFSKISLRNMFKILKSFQENPWIIHFLEFIKTSKKISCLACITPCSSNKVIQLLCIVRFFVCQVHIVFCKLCFSFVLSLTPIMVEHNPSNKNKINK